MSSTVLFVSILTATKKARPDDRSDEKVIYEEPYKWRFKSMIMMSIPNASKSTQINLN
jgi:hypothetical protein